jgi:Cu-Zn family superoxide dismutase
MHVLAFSSVALLIATGVAIAQQLTVDINRISDAGVGEKIGTIVVSEAKGAVSFKVSVTGLPKGQRGFHVHEKGDCGTAMKNGRMTAGEAAGAHFDPDGKKSHKGPKGAGHKGHKGDLPLLNGTDKGISQTVTAPRLKLADVQGRSIVIHEGGDNYSDNPENGGGGGRIACGVVPKQ